MRKWNAPNLTNFRANLGQMRICINLPVTVNTLPLPVLPPYQSSLEPMTWVAKELLFSRHLSHTDTWQISHGEGGEGERGCVPQPCPIPCPIPGTAKSLAQAPAPLGQSVTGCHRQMEFCHKCCCSWTEVALLVVVVATGTSDIFSCKISRSCIFKSAQKRIRAANCCQTS